MPRLCCHLVALEAKRRSVRSKTASRGVLFSPLLMCACAVIGRGWQALTGQGVESLCKTPSLPVGSSNTLIPELGLLAVHPRGMREFGPYGREFEPIWATGTASLGKV